MKANVSKREKKKLKKGNRLSTAKGTRTELKIDLFDSEYEPTITLKRKFLMS